LDSRTDDPGLELPSHVRPDGTRYVGRAHAPVRRFSDDAAFDEFFRELQRGFGPQHWWPAESPFEVLVGAVLTQNTAWRNVELALGHLKRARLITPTSLLCASDEVLERALRPSGYFRAKTKKLRALCTWYVEVGGLRALVERPLEPLRTELLTVHGIGPETADSILCYGAGRRTPVIDAYTRRIFARHGLADGEATYEELRGFVKDRLVRSQAVYEEFHALCVRAGYDNCKPKPRCDDCPATPPACIPGSLRDSQDAT